MIKNIIERAKATRIPFRVLALVMALVILCAGTVFAASSESYIVDIYEGSQITRVETSLKDAYAIVEEAKIELSKQDKLILDNFTAGAESEIVVCRSSNVRFVHIDGTVVETVFAGTVEELIKSQGVELSDKLVSSVNTKAVVTNSMEVQILNFYDLTINVDGETRQVKSTAKTVRDLLAEQGITLDSDDETVPAIDSELSHNLVIDVLRVEYVTREATEKVPFQKKTVKSSAMLKGTSKITTKGVNGEKIVIYKDRVVNGEVAETSFVSETITKYPVAQVTTEGTLTNGNSKIEKNGTPISEIPLPDKYSIGANNVPTSYKYTITGKAAAYCVPGGTTSTGKAVKPGYIAVDPKQIPYGTEMWIVSNDGVVYGYCIAADTGGCVDKGKCTVDLYMNSKSQCRQWGARNVTSYVL